MKEMFEHDELHKKHQVASVECDACGISVVLSGGHARHVCFENEQRGHEFRSTNRRRKLARNDEYIYEDDVASEVDDQDCVDQERCPNCQRPLTTFGSENAIYRHLENCASAGLDGEEAFERSSEELAQFNEDFAPSYAVYQPHEPLWKNNILLSRQREMRMPHKLADDMLLTTMQYGGQILSKSVMEKLYALLNLKEFRVALSCNSLSSSYYLARKHQMESFKKCWTCVTVEGGGEFYCRDLADVICEILDDEDLVNDADFEGSTDEGDVDQDEDLDADKAKVVWGSRWTQFPTYQKRRQLKRQCDWLSLMLWADSGETSRGRARRAHPITLVCLVPLNVSPSFARRRDCIFPVAFFDTSEESVSVTVVLHHLLPQLCALRNGYFYPKRLDKKLCVAIDGLTGDYPAVTEMVGTLSSANSHLPCKLCLARQDVTSGINEKANLFMPSRTLRRTLSMVQENQNLEKTPFQQTCGIRAEFRNRPNPLWSYYKDDRDMFELVMFDKLHDVYLGLLKVCFKALAIEVKKSNEAVGMFRTCLTRVARLPGIDATMIRAKDFNDNCKTTLLDLLGGGHGSLMAREMQALAPVLLVVFDACNVETVRNAIEPLSRLVHFCAALESRLWPIKNYPEEWWKSLKNFAIDAFLKFQSFVPGVLSKQNKFVKIHNVLAHAVDIRRRHGPAGDVSSLEGLFGTIKDVPTNKKEVAAQVMQRLEEFRGSGKRLQVDPNLKVLCDIVHKDHKVRESATSVSGDIMNAANNFFVQNGLQLRRWLKRIPLPVDQLDSGVDRGVRCLYAAESWHNREAYSVIEQGKTYLMLRGIAEVSDEHGTLHFIGVGFDLITHLAKKAIGPRLGYRMPILRKKSNHKLSCLKLELKELAVVCLVPHLREVDGSFKKQLAYESDVRFDEGDEVYHHNIFVTRGEFRYPYDLMWFPINEQ